MNMNQKKPISIHRICRLPDNFWQQLTQTPWHFDLFQTLRRIDAQSGAYYMLGSAPLPKHDILRLGQKASMIFAPSTITEVKQQKNSNLYDMLIYSFGLFGPNGPLPLHITEYTYSRQYNYQDPTLNAFANLFHHRLILLFYRAWANTQPTVSLDRQDNQRFCHYLSCLVGMGLPAQQTPDTINDHARYSLSGHLSRQGHSAEGLEKILFYYFNIPLKIVQNIPQWLEVGLQDQAQLKAGRNMPRLGESAFLGIALYNIQHKFRIELGPLRIAEYKMFLPGESKSNQLRDWVYQYLGIEYAWDVRLTLHQSDVKGIHLSEPTKLGLNSWLGKIEQSIHRGDLIYTPK
ncbi:type VI secretion system baseplate subunit TssG [Xenorhabdus anantnagensis]|uniref:Type VI secretion system baseplate subunit TssG n=1 Tax=Xenorhabdus anantnagensis TaxID=3025875 RepID=A0ABT5LNZ2_9GAMM|nr:type VI secretion system baseplate subunit TssG [Xenorhabdus anantnagensis]MDC9596152.1 type VI secretion system baseplate subunit TssG [Xenorhabdus anantnagensis]